MRDEKGVDHDAAPGAQTGGRAETAGPIVSPHASRDGYSGSRLHSPDPYGSGLWTPSPERDYVKLLIRREAGTQDKYLLALRATADYYGWTKQFPAWTPRIISRDDRYIRFYSPSHRGELRTEAGKRLVISRAKSTSGWPTGQANAFKVSANCSNFDLAEIAHFVDVDWYWMEGLYGQRKSRSEWEAIYQAGTSRKRAGLVSE